MKTNEWEGCEGTSAGIISLGTGWCESSSSRSGRFVSGERDPVDWLRLVHLYVFAWKAVELCNILKCLRHTHTHMYVGRKIQDVSQPVCLTSESDSGSNPDVSALNPT